jgi:hypothetical protein
MKSNGHTCRHCRNRVECDRSEESNHPICGIFFKVNVCGDCQNQADCAGFNSGLVDEDSQVCEMFISKIGRVGE